MTWRRTLPRSLRRQAGFIHASLRALLFQRPFSPLDWFRAGEQGAWYDPQDTSTLFQDAAGTTPVTAVEQPVGLMLDMRFGGVRGAELVTNGTFDAGTTGWTAANSTLSVVAGYLRVTNSGAVFGYAYQAIPTEVNKWYEITANTLPGSAAAARVYAGTSQGGLQNIALVGTSPGGPIRGVFVATQATTYISCLNLNTSNGTWDFDNISVREVPGNHATQGTAASRPVYSKRYNQILATENLAGPDWTKAAAGSASVPVVTNNYGVAPDGTLTAARVQFALNGGTTTADFSQLSPAAAASGVSGASYVTSVWVATADGSTKNVNFVGANGAAVSRSVTGTWQEVRLAQTSAASSIVQLRIRLRGSELSTADSADLLVWHPDFRSADDAAKNIPAYQRVNTSSDYDTEGFPAYLRVDGSDDSMGTAGSVDFSGTDKLTLLSGVTKLSDAATAVLVELTTSASSNDGGFNVFAPHSNGLATYYTSSRGTTQVAAFASGYAAPNSAVVTGIGHISGDIAQIRVNGSVGATTTTDQGTGNYANAALHLFSRAGSSLRFNGRFYGAVICGAERTTAQIAQAERWMARRMGVSL